MGRFPFTLVTAGSGMGDNGRDAQGTRSSVCRIGPAILYTTLNRQETGLMGRQASKLEQVEGGARGGGRTNRHVTVML
jgi:hypothetical protein